MCEPVTIAATIAVVSTVAQGYAAKKQGKYQKGVADYNARVQENEATEVRTKGVEEENIMREKTAKLISKQKAQLGAANVELGTGSALDIQEETELLGEVDALRIKSNFERKATSLETQAELTRAEGEAAEKSGKQAFLGSLLSGAGQGIGAMDGGGGGVAGKWFTPDSALSISGGAGLKPLRVS